MFFNPNLEVYEMAYLDGLKVVTATKPANLPPAINRRNNLINKLDKQLHCAKAKSEGREHYVVCTKTIANELGEATRIEQQKRVKPWWFRSNDGKLVLNLRYANKRLELVKGKTGIEVENIESLIPAIKLIKKAVENGELDNSLAATAKTIRSELAK
jgi:Family of unknown function (DUF6641)